MTSWWLYLPVAPIPVALALMVMDLWPGARVALLGLSGALYLIVDSKVRRDCDRARRELEKVETREKTWRQWDEYRCNWKWYWTERFPVWWRPVWGSGAPPPPHPKGGPTNPLAAREKGRAGKVKT